MPPAPMRHRISYGPRRSPAVNVGIWLNQFSLVQRDGSMQKPVKTSEITVETPQKPTHLFFAVRDEPDRKGSREVRARGDARSARSIIQGRCAANFMRRMVSQREAYRYWAESFDEGTPILALESRHLAPVLFDALPGKRFL